MGKKNPISSTPIPASSGSAGVAVPTVVERPNLVISVERLPGGLVTWGDMQKAFEGMPPETVITLFVGPDYQEAPMRDAVYWEKHGAVFLMGEVEEEDDEDAVEGDWIEEPRDIEEEVHDAAEPA